MGANITGAGDASTDRHVRPIPYSKITGEELKTSYDTQEEVYKNLFTDLNEAIETFKSYVASNPQGTPFAEFDRVYGGNMNQWIKYANSLKLRMAIRIRYADPALAREMGEAAVKDGVITANADNAMEAYAKNPIEVMWNAMVTRGFAPIWRAT